MATVGDRLWQRAIVLGGSIALAVAAVSSRWWSDDVAVHAVVLRQMTAPAEGERLAAVAAVAGREVDSVPITRIEVGEAREAAVREAAVRVATEDEQRFVHALGDDGVPGNATAACLALIALPTGPLPAVEAALLSHDAQQRHFAAGVLRCRCQERGALPSLALLRISVSALRSDLLLEEPTSLYPCVTQSARFLAPHAQAAMAPLREALESNDAQQRFLAAFLLAQTGTVDLAPRLAHILAAHLGDNQIAGDALLAVHGLYRLGPAALPTVRDWRRHADAQAGALLDLVVLDWFEPPSDRRALTERRRLHDVTRLYHDPAIEFELARSVVPRWRTRH